MNKILFIVLCSTSIYSQSFSDTSVAVGRKLVKELNPIGAVEIRYNKFIINDIWLSASGNYELEAIPTKKVGLMYNYNLNLYPRLGLTTILLKGIYTTAGISFKIKNNKGFWPYPYSRIDLKLITTEQGNISSIIDIEQDRILIGIAFKDSK